MIPLVMTKKELQMMKTVIDTVAKDVGYTEPYQVGTMIELPRAALRAANAGFARNRAAEARRRLRFIKTP